jgi:hypothetical protein
MKNRSITILSFGGGQDSTAILMKLIHDQDFRKQYAPGELWVIMADTGNEHPSTVRHVKFVRDLCAKLGILFFHVTADLGFHGSAPDLLSYWRKTNSVGSKRFPKTCTDRLKIRPIYKFIDAHLGTMIQAKSRKPKAATIEWAQQNGKIRVLIGIAKGEEKRVAGEPEEKWRRESFEYSYPLIDLGMDRSACQKFISSQGYLVPYPSNCILCPFMSEIELLWLIRHDPGSFWTWVEIEQNKLEKNRHLDAVEVQDKKTGKTRIVNKNLGVWGEKTLLQKRVEVEAKFGSMSDADLDEYKFSHGHCVASKY